MRDGGGGGGEEEDVVAGAEGVRPSLHAGALQQLLGLLVPRAQLELLPGDKGPAAAQRGGGLGKNNRD